MKWHRKYLEVYYGYFMDGYVRNKFTCVLYTDFLWIYHWDYVYGYTVKLVHLLLTVESERDKFYSLKPFNNCKIIHKFIYSNVLTQ